MWDVLAASGVGLGSIVTVTTLTMLLIGVAVGIVLGILPGLGGVIGLTLVLPFTLDMDPIAALVLMVALSSVVATSDTIPAVIFGVPGTVGCAATVLDGHPMAKRGEAGRALGAAFSASCIGGILGALVLVAFIPVLRPAILSVGSPEMFAFCVFGLSLAAVLSGNQPLKGLAAGCLGIWLALIGLDPQVAGERWTYGSLYLQDGLSVAVVALGFFALPELADLAIRRHTIAGGRRQDASGQRQGFADVLRNKWLVLRCSGIGAGLGAIPGIGAAVIDWVAYGHAMKTERGAAATFGKGDVRGVIASESSNNAKQGGALIPTIAFGVPGSPAMAILLGAFLIVGVVPGPDMLSRDLDITMALVWTVVIANLVAAIVCILFADRLGLIALIRPHILVPVVLAVVMLGALQASHRWEDLWVLMAAGVIGWVMKRFGWPRPPLILGFVLGALLERYLFISVGRWGWEWLTNWVVMLTLALALWTFAGGFVKMWWSRGGTHRRMVLVAPDVAATLRSPGFWVAAAFVGLFTFVLVTVQGLASQAALAPGLAAGVGLACALLALPTELRGRGGAPVIALVAPGDAGGDRLGDGGLGGDGTAAGMSGDLVEDYAGLTPGTVRRRAWGFAAWTAGFAAGAYLIGVLPAMFLHLFVYMRLGWGERTLVSLIVATVVTAFALVLFKTIINIPWPLAVIGDLFPALRHSYRLF